MQSSIELLGQALRCLERAESTYDKRLADQLIELSQQLHHEADLAAVREDAERRCAPMAARPEASFLQSPLLMREGR